MSQYIKVKSISQRDSRTLAIDWTDGTSQKWDVVDLRRACPCASCIDEWTGKNLIKEGQINDKVRPISINSVGQYALSINFSDGHSTGIYSFEKLRSLS